MAHRLLILGLVTAFSLGCTAEYTKTLARSSVEDTGAMSRPSIAREQAWVLAQNTRLYLAYPSLPTDDTPRPLNRTQYQLAQLLALQFGRHFPATKVTLQEAPLKTLLAHAARENCAILVVPALEHLSQNPYAQHNSAQSAEKNQLWLNLHLYDVGSHRHLDTLKISHQQGWADWRTREPSALFEASIAQALKQLVGT